MGEEERESVFDGHKVWVWEDEKVPDHGGDCPTMQVYLIPLKRTLRNS